MATRVPTRQETHDTYRRSLGSADPLRSLQQAPLRLRKAIAGLGEADAPVAEKPGKWSVRDVLSHLADGEIILGSRLRFIAAHDRPGIPGFDENLFLARLGVGNTTAKKLYESFVHARRSTLELLERLPEEAYARVGIHSERGAESVADLVAADRWRHQPRRSVLERPREQRAHHRGRVALAPVRARGHVAALRPPVAAPRDQTRAGHRRRREQVDAQAGSMLAFRRRRFSGS